MEANLKQIIWDNFDLLQDMFTVKIKEKLEELQNENDKESFYYYLELVFDIDSSLTSKIEHFYLENLSSNDIILELSNVLKIDEQKRDYLSKKKYLDLVKATLARKDLEFNTKESADLYDNYAKLIEYFYSGFEKAKEYLEKALKIRLKVLGEKHLDTTQSYNNLAICYFNIDDLEKAKEYLEESLKIRLEVLGEEHTDTAESYNNLGLYYYKKKDVEKTKEYLEESLKIRLKVLGEKHLDTAESYNNLAVYYSYINDLDKAQEYNEKSLKVRLEVLGEEHTDTAQSYNSLGSCNYKKNKLEKAKEYLEKALKIRLAVLGEEHADTARSYNNISAYYFTIKDFEKTKEYNEKALKIRLKVLGENHLDTAQSYSVIGAYYSRIKDFEKTKEYNEKALRIKLKVLGENHPDTAQSYSAMGVYYSNIKDLKKAKEYYDKALKIRFEVLGENHLHTAQSYNNLGVYYSRKNNLEKARDYFEKALKISLKFENKFSNISPDTKLKYNNLQKTSYKKFFINSDFNISPFIKKAKIENFKLLEDFEIEFSRNINIIIGENSSGKTSLLQALTLGLLEENYSGESNEKYPSFITKNKDSANIDLRIDEYSKSVVITSQERIIDNIILSPFVLSYGSNIFTKYKLEVNDLVSDILEKKIGDNFTSSIFKDYVDEFHNPKSILTELERINTPRAKEVKKIFIDTINNLQDEYKLKYKNEKYFFEHKNENIFKLENLSEGYRNNILLITDILVRILGIGKTPETIEGIILIDEFDRHLHPKWQSNIVSKLINIFPKIQFILTTHNPMSILDRNDDEITIIKEVDGKLEAQKGTGTKNIDVGMVLLKYFGVHSLIGDEMQGNLSKLTRLNLLDKLTDEQKNEQKNLEDKLGETVATNFIYNKGYFQFLKFLKKHKDIEFDKLDDMSEEEIDDLLKDFEESL